MCANLKLINAKTVFRIALESIQFGTRKQSFGHANDELTDNIVMGCEWRDDKTGVGVVSGVGCENS